MLSLSRLCLTFRAAFVRLKEDTQGISYPRAPHGNIEPATGALSMAICLLQCGPGVYHKKVAVPNHRSQLHQLHVPPSTYIHPPPGGMPCSATPSPPSHPRPPNATEDTAQLAVLLHGKATYPISTRYVSEYMQKVCRMPCPAGQLLITKREA